MSKEQLPPLDPLIEGYLDYLADVGRKASGTVIDVRCTLRRVNAAMPHQFMVLTKRKLSIGTEIDLFAADLDVPKPARFTEKRLRKMWHGEPSKQETFLMIPFASQEGSPVPAWLQPSGNRT